jgi:hypothetical protein
VSEVTHATDQQRRVAIAAQRFGVGVTLASARMHQAANARIQQRARTIIERE